MIHAVRNASVAFANSGYLSPITGPWPPPGEAIAAWTHASMRMFAFWAAAAVLAVTVVARTIYSWVRWAQ